MISILFARRDSIYKSLDCDVWDEDRNALEWQGGNPVVCHPPCRAWGQLRHMAKPIFGERDLAIWAIAKVREFGGVLEHPYKSVLWIELNLPEPGFVDDYGGFTLPIFQSWFGHKADKPTKLYICGLPRKNMPAIPLVLGDAKYICGTSGRRVNGTRLRPGDLGYRPEISKSEREHTPLALAQWLCEVAMRVKKS